MRSLPTSSKDSFNTPPTQESIQKALQDFLRSIPDERKDRITLVGGQSLAFWFSWALDNTKPAYLGELDSDPYYAAITSNDIDFWTPTKDDAKVTLDNFLKNDASGEYATTKSNFDNNADHNAEQFGKAVLPVRQTNQSITIDFMQFLFGISKDEINKHARQAVHIHLGHIAFRVIDPPLITKSRVENLFALKPQGENLNRELIRIKAAIRITALYITFLAERRSDQKSALSAANFIIDYAQSRHDIRLYNQYNLDLLDAIPQTKALPEKFYSEHLKRSRAFVERKRERNKRQGMGRTVE